MSDDRARDEVAAGTVLAGRFRVEALLGSGGMADVYRTTDLARQVPVALKLLRRDIAEDARSLERLRREADVLRVLEHPGIVKVETFGALPDDRLFLVMELLEGETLGARMRRGPLNPRDLTDLLEPTLGALHYAHEHGVIHRDLKPDNIFLCVPDAESPTKILDFGISKVYGAEKLTQTGQILGTPRYMPPEQLTGDSDLDRRLDIYAMGVILYEALVGASPFPARSASHLVVSILQGNVIPLSSMRADISAEIIAVITRAMSAAREARFADALALLAAWKESAPSLRSERPPATVRRAQKTNLLGTFEGGAPAAREGEGRFVAGTFSAFERPQAAAPAAVGPAVASPSEVTAPQARPVPVPGEIRPAGPSPEKVPLAEPPRGASSEVERPSASMRIPMSRGPLALLAAGAVILALLSAGTVIAVMYVMNGGAEKFSKDGGSRGAVPTSVTPPASAVTPAPGPAAPVSDEARVDAVSAPVVPGAPAPPVGFAEDTPEEPRSRRRPERGVRGRARALRRGPAHPAGSEAAASSDELNRMSARGLLREARRALKRHDATTCVSLVERALDKGAPASALRLKGDCLLRSGDSDEALRAYERFCRLVPDHPAITEVRGIVEGLGGSC